MNISAERVWCDDTVLWVGLRDGRILGVPLAWFPRLLAATPDQRARCEIGRTGQGLHWDALDEDISVPGLLRGRPDRALTRATAA